MLRALLWIGSAIENYTFQNRWLSHKYLTPELPEQAAGSTPTRASILEAAVKIKSVVIQAGLHHVLQRHIQMLFPPKHPKGHSLPIGSLQTRVLQLSGSKWELNLCPVFLRIRGMVISEHLQMFVKHLTHPSSHFLPVNISFGGVFELLQAHF